MRFALGRRLARLGRHQTKPVLFKVAPAFGFALYSVAAALGASAHAQASFEDAHGDGAAVALCFAANRRLAIGVGIRPAVAVD
jgi:hypothetical protein